jgi:hypothetical protein
MDGPVICWRDAIVYQAIDGLHHGAVDQEAKELEGGDGRGGGICNGADVGGTEGARFDEDEEAADGQQSRGDNVACGAIVDEVEYAIELGTGA